MMRFLPEKLKQKLHTELQAQRLKKALDSLVPGKVPSEEQLVTLGQAWGHDGYSAADVCLRSIADYAATTDGPILECGSGLSTLVMSVLAGRRGVPIYSLEHHESYFGHVSRLLRRLQLSKVNLVLAPLRSKGDFEWYDVQPTSFPDKFQLIICDGPPSDTKGGRYGLFPVLKNTFAPGATLLLDDVDRPEEQQILRRWCDEEHLVVEREINGQGTSVAICRVPSV
jgi:hypothetical protein